MLDEATSNLDVDTERRIAGELNKLVKARELTLVPVSRRPNFREYCDKVIAIE